MRVLLCEVRGFPVGLTAQYIHGLWRVEPECLLSVAERQAVTIHNEFIPVVPLAELIDLPPRSAGAPATGKGALLVVVQARSEKLALRVDELLDERDMVIKPLPEHMRRLGLVDGMVMTGRNELVSVLHVPELLERSRATRRAAAAPAAGDEAHRVPQVLVVDDSLNTREIEKDVLEAHGYRVTLAEDGLDGWAKARAGEFDAVLTDVEMPGLDGFGLTERLRAEPRYRHRPIIIVTSREKEEDKRRGIQVGADAYIVKGDFEQRSLIETLHNLLG
jgi:two-component system chemotaxis sensor kinase CheA